MNKFILMQMVRFGIVGLTCAFIHFSTVVLLVQIFSLEPLIANIFGFIVSFQVNYWGHRLWTFNDTSVLHRVAFPKLFFIQCVNFLANEMLFYIFLSLHLPYPVALFIVLTILPLFTYVSSRMWVFR